MDYRDYIGLTQLAVAFNFAFTYIKGVGTNKLFEGYLIKL